MLDMYTYPLKMLYALAIVGVLVVLTFMLLMLLMTKPNDLPMPPPEHFLIRGHLHNEQATFAQKVGDYCFTFIWHDSQSTMVSRIPCETVKN